MHSILPGNQVYELCQSQYYYRTTFSFCVTRQVFQSYSRSASVPRNESLWSMFYMLDIHPHHSTIVITALKIKMQHINHVQTSNRFIDINGKNRPGYNQAYQQQTHSSKMANITLVSSNNSLKKQIHHLQFLKVLICLCQ